MVSVKGQISPQYAVGSKIVTTILNVVNPAHYIVRESPGLESSPQARYYYEMEEAMQKFYSLVEQSFNTQIPSKNSIVVVLHKSKFYRARVLSILNLTAGYTFKVYLLDYGEDCNVPSSCMYEIRHDFLAHPFQAVHFKLLGIQPIGLVMGNLDLTLSYGPVSDWDESAENFMNNLLKGLQSAWVEVVTVDQDCLYGKLFMSFGDGTVKCINDELISQKFAHFNGSCPEGAADANTKSAVMKPATTIKNTTVSPSPASPIPEVDPDLFKVSFINPSDGKVVAESSMLTMTAPCLSDDENMENGNKENEPSINDEVESKSSVSPLGKSSLLFQKLKQMTLKSPPQNNGLENNPLTAHGDDGARNSISHTNQISSIKHDSSNVQDSNVFAHEELTPSSSVDNCDKESSKADDPESLKVVSSNYTKLQSFFNSIKVKKSSNCEASENKSILSGTSDKTLDVTPSSIESSVLASPSNPEHKPSSLSHSPIESLSPSQTEKKTLYLQKLQHLKSKDLLPKSSNSNVSSSPEVSQNQVHQDPVMDINNNDDVLNASVSTTSSEISIEASKSPPNKDLSSQSLHAPVPGKVSSKTLQDFFQKKKILSSKLIAKAGDNCSSANCNDFPKNLKPASQSIRADVSPKTCAKTENEVSKIASKPSIPEPKAGDFVCSSPKLGRKINLSPAGSESTVQNVEPPRNKEIKVPKQREQKKSFDKSSSSDSLGVKPHQLQSRILQEMSGLSDSDDIWSKLATKRKNDSFSDSKSDLDDSFGNLDLKFDDSSSRLLINFEASSLWEKQKVPVLQIGTAIPKPVLNVEEAEFSSNLRQVLKEIKFHGPSSIQSVVWPSIARRRNLIAIAPPHSGKTVSYVLPLVSTFTDAEIPLPKGVGPFAIILCSSWKKVQAVYDFFHLFLGDAKLKITTFCTYESSVKQRVLTLINGSDILISTPFALLCCLKDNLVNFSRCTNFIFDDGTALMSYQKDEVREILVHFVDAVMAKEIRPQIVVCAERWDKNFNVILDNLMSMPLLFFTSFLESAIYAKIQFKCHVCLEAEKKNKLLDAIKDATNVVVCTASKEDASDIHHFLRCEDVRTYLVTEDFEHYIAEEVIKDWKSARFKTSAHTLVITDQALTDMSISNADCLVHYDVPHDSRLQFGNRFSCIAENFQDKEQSEKCVCHILVSGNDHQYAQHLVKIVENSGGKASKELKKLCKMDYTSDKLTSPLCPHFKAFGFCRKSNCANRHSICPQLDKPNVVPPEGDILGLVTHVEDASHFFVRILKYMNPDSSELVPLVSAYAKVSFDLRKHYCSVSEETLVENPVVGEVYVLADGGDLFYRVKVLEKVEPRTAMEKTKWKVRYLDEGWLKCIEKLKIYPLCEELELPPPLAAEVYACNIMTPDASMEWNPRTNNLVSCLIKGKEIHGKIALCVGDTLLLDPVLQRKHLNSIGDYINVLKLDQQLVELGHAKENKMHLKVLRKACEDKIPLPSILRPSVKKEEIKKPDNICSSHAFLECDTEEEVYVSSVISPHHFYVQRSKFVDCLDDLLDKINTQIENKSLKRIFSFYKDMQCVGPFFEDDRYYRAIVTDILEDDNVQLFYPDFGDSGRVSKREIYALSSEFTLLPFQAIECELAGISPAHGGWSEAASDKLYDLTRDEAGDMKVLHLKVYDKTVSYRGGNHYSVELWHESKSVSQQLIDLGFGLPASLPDPPSYHDASSEQQNGNKDRDSKEGDSTDESAEKEAVDFVAFVLNKMAQDNCQEAPAKQPVTITEVTSEEESANRPNTEVTARIFRKSNGVGGRKPVKNTMQEEDRSTIKPLITWWNTPEKLSVLINLKNVKLYDLDLKDVEFSFNTIIAGVQYFTKETFYEKINSLSASVFQNSQGINIVAQKQVPLKWPRLVADKTKFLHIKYDLIHIDDLESEDFSGDVNKNYQEPMPIDPEYAEEESTDEDEKYVEPWAKISDPYHSLR